LSGGFFESIGEWEEGAKVMGTDGKKDKEGKSIRLDELFVELQRDAQIIEPGLPVFEKRKVNSDLNSAHAPLSEASLHTEPIGYQEEEAPSGGSRKQVIWGGLLLFVVILVVALVFLNGYIF
jgi:hypothetical protein